MNGNKKQKTKKKQNEKEEKKNLKTTAWVDNSWTIRNLSYDEIFGQLRYSDSVSPREMVWRMDCLAWCFRLREN